MVISVAATASTADVKCVGYIHAGGGYMLSNFISHTGKYFTRVFLSMSSGRKEPAFEMSGPF